MPPEVSAKDKYETFGWPAVPRSFSKVLETERSSNASARSVKIDEVQLPDCDLAKRILEYAKNELEERTFSHSMRVYYYGIAILKDHFPSWKLSPETYFLTCMLHDIGTTKRNMHGTLLSFEFYGAKIAYDKLLQLQAPTEQAEAVMEAIIRHQDLGETGYITQLGQLIQLATVFDNAGKNPSLVKTEFIDSICETWKRNGWSSCFASTVREEIKAKPYAHSTALDGFAEMVEGNELMEPWD